MSEPKLPASLASGGLFGLAVSSDKRPRVSADLEVSLVLRAENGGPGCFPCGPFLRNRRDRPGYRCAAGQPPGDHLSQVSPYHLPLYGSAPVSVFIAGHIATTNGSVPPQLEKLTIKLNRHGNVNDTGLPARQSSQIQPNSTQHALQRCSHSLVGSGQFWAKLFCWSAVPNAGSLPGLLSGWRRRTPSPLCPHICHQSVRHFLRHSLSRFSDLAHGVYGTESQRLPSRSSQKCLRPNQDDDHSPLQLWRQNAKLRKCGVSSAERV